MICSPVPDTPNCAENRAEKEPQGARMQVPQLPRGIVPLFETPFLENGAMDYDSLPRLIDFSIREGVNGLTAPLVASEVQALSQEERGQIVKLAAETIAGRVPFIVGASSDD